MPSTHLKKIIPLSVALLVLASYNFIDAQWSPAPSGPPDGNALAPINVSSATQSKAGRLNLGSATISGGLSLGGGQVIRNGAPTIKLEDTNGRDFWLRANSNKFYVLGNRNNSGGWDTPYPLVMELGANSSSDVATFSNDVQANRYCNKAGSCISATELAGLAGGGGGEKYERRALRADAKGWKSYVGTGGTVEGMTFDEPSYDWVWNSKYDQCFLTTSVNVMANHSQYNGGGGCRLYISWGRWVLKAYADKRMVTKCEATCTLR